MVLVAVAAIRSTFYPVTPLVRTVPRRTALMEQRIAEAAARGRRLRIDRRWVPYAAISPLLRRAVLVAEDDAFFSHGGLDWDEIKASARTDLARGRLVRGGSTITQQLARNLFLGDRRTLMRKLTEVFLALRLEHALSKRRIFELYLNLIEWGDGIYGAEAAAQHSFHVGAGRLDERQAILLAAVIINPRRYPPTHPGRRIERRVRTIASRLRRRGFLSEAQYQAALGQPAPAPPPFSQWFFGRAPDSAAGAGVPAADSLPAAAPGGGADSLAVSPGPPATP